VHVELAGKDEEDVSEGGNDAEGPVVLEPGVDLLDLRL